MGKEIFACYQVFVNTKNTLNNNILTFKDIVSIQKTNSYMDFLIPDLSIQVLLAIDHSIMNDSMMLQELNIY